MPAACCQLLSVARHLGEASAELFLVVCDVEAHDIAAAEAFFAARSVVARIIHRPEIADQIVPVTRRWPRAAYLRLYFDQLFDAEYARLVYFDADTRVRADLAPLLGADLRGRPAGAVHDFIYYLTGNIRRRRRELMLAADAPYLQSGVMVFDWPQTLAIGALRQAREFLAKHPDRCQEAPDQDALNAALENRWTPLDPRWNLHETYLMFGGKLQPFLEHYTSTKPWSPRRPARWVEAADWYHTTLEDTVWSDFVRPQTARDMIVSRLSALRFVYGPKVRRLLAQNFPAVLDVLGHPRLRSDERELPWAPRSRRDVEDMAFALLEEAQAIRGLIRPPESVLQGFNSGPPIGLL